MATEKPSLSRLDWLLGEWRGFGLLSKELNLIRKSFRYELDGKILVERTISMVPPGGPTTEFEQHQDLLVYYPEGESIRARGFYVEGFHSSSDVEVEDDGREIVVTSTEIVNGASNMAVRDTLMRKGKDEFEATFEIDWKGEGFELSQKIRMQRVV